MNDILLDVGRNPQLRKAFSAMGLPVALPQDLKRNSGPWPERPIHNRSVVVACPEGAQLSATLASALAPMGANPHVVTYAGDSSLEPFVASGEAFGRPPQGIAPNTSLEPGLKPHALLFDATGLATVDGTEHLYAFFHHQIRALARCGRIVVIARPPSEGQSLESGVVSRALEGFVRSVGKEIGRRGATAQLVYVAAGAEDRLEAVLRFLLSEQSAFISGQVLNVTKSVAAAEPKWVRPLEGKVALITGAARGIGAATARRMAQEGCNVIVLDRPQDDGPASKIAQEVGGNPPMLFDITDPATPEELAKALKEQYGGVDIVVHNAGITRDKTLGRMKPEFWSQALDVNLGAVIRTTNALVEQAVLRDGGRLVCLTSIAGLAGNVGQTNYATAKAGLVELVHRLASSLEDRGITANAIAPGFIETRMTQAIPAVTREAGRRLSSLSQGGLPDDVANAITFLASPGSDGINGQVLRVCGGNFLGA